MGKVAPSTVGQSDLLQARQFQNGIEGIGLSCQDIRA
jgi:hypothetical protein